MHGCVQAMEEAQPFSETGVETESKPPRKLQHESIISRFFSFSGSPYSRCAA